MKMKRLSAKERTQESRAIRRNGKLGEGKTGAVEVSNKEGPGCPHRLGNVSLVLGIV